MVNFNIFDLANPNKQTKKILHLLNTVDKFLQVYKLKNFILNYLDHGYISWVEVNGVVRIIKHSSTALFSQKLCIFQNVLPKDVPRLIKYIFVIAEAV